MKECTCLNRVYGTLVKKDLHVVETSSVYSVHAECSFYTVLCCKTLLLEYLFGKGLLCLQNILHNEQNGPKVALPRTIRISITQADKNLKERVYTLQLATAIVIRSYSERQHHFRCFSFDFFLLEHENGVGLVSVIES
jgi:hypothetical protein